MHPSEYADDYRQRMREQGVVYLPADDPYRLKYGCNTLQDRHVVMAAEAAAEDELLQAKRARKNHG